MAEYQNQYSDTLKARSGTESSERERNIIVGDYLMLFKMPPGSETERFGTC